MLWNSTVDDVKYRKGHAETLPVGGGEPFRASGVLRRDPTSLDLNIPGEYRALSARHRRTVGSVQLACEAPQASALWSLWHVPSLPRSWYHHRARHRRRDHEALTVQYLCNSLS